MPVAVARLAGGTLAARVLPSLAQRQVLTVGTLGIGTSVLRLELGHEALLRRRVISGVAGNFIKNV